jgi:hypothetical protein
LRLQQGTRHGERREGRGVRALGLARRFCVWTDIPEKQKNGLPAASTANPTTEAKGKPSCFLEKVASVAKPCAAPERRV